MHYLDEGSGDPIVMVHGNPSWSFYYRNLVQALSGDHRCIVPDHIGCGLSDKPDDTSYPYTLEQRVEDLTALLDEAGVFSGTHRETGEAMVAPELLDYVAKEVERDASVMKQIRKAREERKSASGQKETA